MNAVHIRRRGIRLAHPRRSWRGPQAGLHATIIILILISLFPVYEMLTVSVKNPVQYQHERWAVSFPMRLGNYTAAWEIIHTYMLNTVFVAVVGFLGMLVLSVIGGYVFARLRFPFREQLYLAIIALLAVPWVISFVPSFMLYHSLGLLNSRWVLIIPNIASGPVFGIFLLRSFFAGIPEEIYESARIDGAGHWTLIWRITLPVSLPVVATLAVLNVVSTWNSFLWPMVTISDKNLQVISVGLFYLSREVTTSSDFAIWGPLFAGYTIASLPLAALFVALGRFYVEGLIESGLKA